jgi:membrane-bound lytic murein transglycosylase D
MISLEESQGGPSPSLSREIVAPTPPELKPDNTTTLESSAQLTGGDERVEVVSDLAIESKASFGCPDICLNEGLLGGFTRLINCPFTPSSSVENNVSRPLPPLRDRLLMVLDDGKNVTTVPDIPIHENRKIKAFIRLYTLRKRDVFLQAIERSTKYMKMIHRIFAEYGLPPNLAYLAVVESNFNPNVRSKANAVGLWQFMSYTGRYFGLTRSWWHDDRYDPEKSTVAAARYLKKLHRRFKGDWELALAAYNSGDGTVRRAIKEAKSLGKSADFWSLRLPRETRGYVPAFFAVASIFKNPQKYGFVVSDDWQDETPRQELMVAGGISLSEIARALSIKQDELIKLNPSLRFQELTPPTANAFAINIPGDTRITQSRADRLEELKKHRQKFWKFHRVKQGDTLWALSRRYRVPIKKILTYNRLKRKNLLSLGQKLVLPIPANWSPPKGPSPTELTKRSLDRLPGVTHVHVVEKGDTLWTLSMKYDIPLRTIRHWNRRILNRRFLKIGTELVLKLPAKSLSTSI